MVYDRNYKDMECMKDLPDNQKDEWLPLWCGCVLRRLKRMTDKDVSKPRSEIDFADFTRDINKLIDDDTLDAEEKHQQQ